jgi:xanthine dehydrogenase YagR molybdenum-binding subunit
MSRVEGPEKVTGQARYAFEYPNDGVAYCYPVLSEVAAGQLAGVDDSAALAAPGVLRVLHGGEQGSFGLTGNYELAIFGTRDITYRGQLVAAVIADTLENARSAASAIRVSCQPAPHDVLLRAGHSGLYRPEKVNPSFPTDTGYGDVDAGLATAAARVSVTYTTPVEHNNPMEPHAAMAAWDHGGQTLTVWNSTQGATVDRDTIASVFGLPPERVRVIAPHVGGGFGSKGTTRSHAILAALAAREVRRPVKVALTRQQMSTLTGHRTSTIQQVTLGATADGALTAVAHDVTEHTSRVIEFAEQTAVATRTMYRTPAMRTTHRLARLNVPTPSWMRAPGECPGMYALESAMDELAVELGMDPVELRIRNDTRTEPDSGLPFSSRHLADCLRDGASRFGWESRDPRPGARRRGRWLTGTGVAASTYPARRAPSSATADLVEGGYVVRVAAADIGTGARTALTRIAAQVLEVAADDVRVEVGDSALPRASVAGGSMGTASWGSAVALACEALAKDGRHGEADTTEDVAADEKLARHSFGAQFAAVLVDPATGEVRVERLLGVFAAGVIIDPVLARSQFMGGMIMGLGMALMERTAVDPSVGGFVGTDLAQYHIPVNADVPDVEVSWIEEEDPHLWPGGGKGIGEIGIVGTAAAIGNAVYHATGTRIRDLPITPVRLLTAAA